MKKRGIPNDDSSTISDKCASRYNEFTFILLRFSECVWFFYRPLVSQTWSIYEFVAQARWRPNEKLVRDRSPKIVILSSKIASTSCNRRTISNSRFTAHVDDDGDVAPITKARIRDKRKRKQKKNNVRVSRKGTRESFVAKEFRRSGECDALLRITLPFSLREIRGRYTWMENSRESSITDILTLELPRGSKWLSWFNIFNNYCSFKRFICWKFSWYLLKYK